MCLLNGYSNGAQIPFRFACWAESIEESWDDGGFAGEEATRGLIVSVGKISHSKALLKFSLIVTLINCLLRLYCQVPYNKSNGKTSSSRLRFFHHPHHVASHESRLGLAPIFSASVKKNLHTSKKVCTFAIPNHEKQHR